MRRIALCLVCTVLASVACRGPAARGTADRAGPAFAAETWDGTTRAGPLGWDAAGPLVGGRRVARDAVRIITRRAAGARGAAATVEGFEPLSDAELRAYRERALAADRKHPGLDAVLCLDYGQNTLTPDGQHHWRYHGLVLVLKEKGREVADLQLGFTEGRSRRRVLFARAIAPDGASTWLDPATMKVSSPAQGRLHLDTTRRMLAGRIPGVEIGALVEFATEYVRYNPDLPDYFFPSYYFQGEEPYLDSIIDVRVPAGRKLNFVTFRMPAEAREPERSTRGGYDVYRWELHDSPPLVPEPLMPDTADLVPRVECSLFFDWAGLHKTTGGYQRERIQATPEIAALATKIVGQATTDDDKLAAIYHWVQRNVNYMSIKASRASGWAGHPAADTLKNGYGDCTDKAIVLASLAKAVGITSYPAIVKTNSAATACTAIPMPDANHCISLVFPNGKPRFIDSTAENYRYPYFRSDDHGIKAIVHMTGQILDVPVPPPGDNLRVSKVELALAPDGSATGLDRHVYNGSYEARVRGFYRRVPPAVRQRVMQQYLQVRAPGATCTGFTLSDLDDLGQQLTMEIRYTIPGLATRTRDLYVVSPPGLARQFPEASLPARKFPIERSTSEAYDNTITVVFPDGHRLVGAPKPLAIHGKHLWFEGTVAVAPDGKSLVIHELFKRLTRLIPAADYPTYRKHATQIAAWTRLKLVFRKP